MKKKILALLTSLGIAGTLLLGGMTPAQAAYGDLTNCYTKTSYTWYSKTYTTICKKQMSSLPVYFQWVVVSQKTYPLYGFNW